VLILAGVLAVTSGCAGAPPRSTSIEQTAASIEAKTEGIPWAKYYEAMSIYKRTKQPYTLLYFTHNDCKPCDLLDKRTLDDPRVIQAVEEFIPIKIRGDVEVQMAQRFDVQTYPMLIFARLDGGEIDRKAGYRDAEFLLQWIKDLKSNKNTMSKLRQELEAKPTDVELLSRQARNYLDSDDLEQALELAQKASEIAPGNANVSVLFALYHLRLGELDQAETAVNAALDADSTNEEASRVRLSVLLKKAENLLKKEDYKGAAEIYSHVMELDDKNLGAVIGMGHVYRKTGEQEKALEEFQKASALRPDSAVPFVALGDIFQEQKNDTTAEQQYLSAIEKEPRYEAPYFRLMELYERNGRRDELLDMFAKVAPIEPAGAHNEIAWLLATSRYPDIFDPVAAEKHAEAAVELEPEPMYIDTLAEVYYAQKKYDLAIAIIKEAIAADPEELDYYKGQLEKFQKARVTKLSGEADAAGAAQSALPGQAGE
jgi:tetratricopeptide (TPR) repeat protein